MNNMRSNFFNCWQALRQAGCGVQEAIYCLLMMENNFITASANIDQLDDEATNVPIVRERIDNATLNTVLSNSFGFGGTNACLVFSRYKD